MLVIGEGDGESKENEEEPEGHKEQDSDQPISKDALNDKSPNR